MAQSYYVIELSKRWLTVLLVALALVMVLAFALGYGAAWSVLSEGRKAPQTVGSAAAATPTPTAVEVVIAATGVPAPTTVEEPTAAPTATPRPAPSPTRTVAPPALPTRAVVEGAFHVQVLASSRKTTVDEARPKLERLGFPRDHQQVVSTTVAGGGVLYKLRIGPFPDRASADRVAQRMQASGFSDAWIVSP
ncbi:MAG: SPOR domain-containing protein [Thermoanaerobaculales bacterium]